MGVIKGLFEKGKHTVTVMGVEAAAKIDPVLLADLLKSKKNREKFWDYYLSDDFDKWLPKSQEILFETSWPEAILTLPFHPKTQYWAAVSVTAVSAIAATCLVLCAGLAATAGAMAMTTFLLAMTVAAAGVLIGSLILANQSSETALSFF